MELKILLASFQIFLVAVLAENKFAGFASLGDVQNGRLDEVRKNGSLDNEGDLGLGIVGGTRAAENEYPWQVSFQARSRSGWVHFCGGSIVSSNVVATAAHCCEGVSGYSLRVYAGSNNLLRTSSPAQALSVSKATIHPTYNSRNTNNDVCRLDLSGNFNFYSKYVQPIKICDNEPVAGQFCDISGWGSTDPSGSGSTTILQKSTEPIISRYSCRRVYGYDKVTENNICIGGLDSEGACKGDSGGPMTCYHEDACLAGATSFGAIPCGQAGAPAAYANLPNFRSFFA